MKNVFLVCFCLLTSFFCFAQHSATFDSRTVTVPKYKDLNEIMEIIPKPEIGMIVYNISTSSFWYYNGVWKNQSDAWTTSGNAGTDQTTNFIGTTDDQDLIFKRNSIQVGRINASKFNLSFGKNALISNTTGASNVAYGDSALAMNTTGDNNAGFGEGTLKSNTIGGSNTAIGIRSLISNISGDNNTAVGSLSLYENSSGFKNTSIGQGSLSNNTTGNENTAVGLSSVFNNKEGSKNTALGAFALSNMEGGNNNIAIGYTANVPKIKSDNQLSIGNSIYGLDMGTASSKIGLGVFDPNFSLDTRSRIRVRDGGEGESAGIWFNDNGNRSLNTFIGIDPKNDFGVYSPILRKFIFSSNMSTGGLRIEGPSALSSTISTLSLGGYGKMEVDAPGVVGGRFTILENGNIGIGNSNPNSPLQFANSVANRKIVLFENVNNDHQYYGIGINSAMQRYQVADLGADHVFFAGNSASTSKELFRLKGNGAIGVNNSLGEAGQVLSSNGPSNPASWKSPNKATAVGQIYDASNINNRIFSSSTWERYPSINEVITIPAGSSGKLLISVDFDIIGGFGCWVCDHNGEVMIEVSGIPITIENFYFGDSGYNYKKCNLFVPVTEGAHTVKVFFRKKLTSGNSLLVYLKNYSTLIITE